MNNNNRKNNSKASKGPIHPWFRSCIRASNDRNNNDDADANANDDANNAIGVATNRNNVTGNASSQGNASASNKRGTKRKKGEAPANNNNLFHFFSSSRTPTPSTASSASTNSQEPRPTKRPRGTHATASTASLAFTTSAAYSTVAASPVLVESAASAASTASAARASSAPTSAARALAPSSAARALSASSAPTSAAARASSAPSSAARASSASTSTARASESSKTQNPPPDWMAWTQASTYKNVCRIPSCNDDNCKNDSDWTPPNAEDSDHYGDSDEEEFDQGPEDDQASSAPKTTTATKKPSGRRSKPARTNKHRQRGAKRKVDPTEFTKPDRLPLQAILENLWQKGFSYVLNLDPRGNLELLRIQDRLWELFFKLCEFFEDSVDLFYEEMWNPRFIQRDENGNDPEGCYAIVLPGGKGTKLGMALHLIRRVDEQDGDLAVLLYSLQDCIKGVPKELVKFIRELNLPRLHAHSDNTERIDTLIRLLCVEGLMACTLKGCVTNTILEVLTAIPSELVLKTMEAPKIEQKFLDRLGKIPEADENGTKLVWHLMTWPTVNSHLVKSKDKTTQARTNDPPKEGGFVTKNRAENLHGDLYECLNCIDMPPRITQHLRPIGNELQDELERDDPRAQKLRWILWPIQRLKGAADNCCDEDIELLEGFNAGDTDTCEYEFNLEPDQGTDVEEEDGDLKPAAKRKHFGYGPYVHPLPGQLVPNGKVTVDRWLKVQKEMGGLIDFCRTFVNDMTIDNKQWLDDNFPGWDDPSNDVDEDSPMGCCLVEGSNKKPAIIHAGHFRMFADHTSIKVIFSEVRSYIVYIELLHKGGNMSDADYHSKRNILYSFLMGVDGANGNKKRDLACSFFTARLLAMPQGYFRGAPVRTLVVSKRLGIHYLDMLYLREHLGPELFQKLLKTLGLGAKFQTSNPVEVDFKCPGVPIAGEWGEAKPCPYYADEFDKFSPVSLFSKEGHQLDGMWVCKRCYKNREVFRVSERQVCNWPGKGGCTELAHVQGRCRKIEHRPDGYQVKLCDWVGEDGGCCTNPAKSGGRCELNAHRPDGFVKKVCDWVSPEGVGCGEPARRYGRCGKKKHQVDLPGKTICSWVGEDGGRCTNPAQSKGRCGDKKEHRLDGGGRTIKLCTWPGRGGCTDPVRKKGRCGKQAHQPERDGEWDGE